MHQLHCSKCNVLLQGRWWSGWHWDIPCRIHHHLTKPYLRQYWSKLQQHLLKDQDSTADYTLQYELWYRQTTTKEEAQRDHGDGNSGRDRQRRGRWQLFTTFTLAHTCTCTSFKAVNPLIGDKPLGHPNKDIIIIIIIIMTETALTEEILAVSWVRERAWVWESVRVNVGVCFDLESLLYNHLVSRPECCQVYSDSCVSVLCRARHGYQLQVNVSEAVFQRIHKPDQRLCGQKENNVFLTPDWVVCCCTCVSLALPGQNSVTGVGSYLNFVPLECFIVIFHAHGIVQEYLVILFWHCLGVI